MTGVQTCALPIYQNETLRKAAIRETFEETGLVVELESKLPSRKYNSKGKEKIVHYWLASIAKDAKFKRNSEVDKLVWKNYKQTLKILTYEDDKKVLLSACKKLGII